MNLDEVKAVVRRFNLEVIQEGRRASFDELMHSSFVNRTAPDGAPSGPESMWNTFQNVLRPALGNMQVLILDQIAEGDKVTTRKTITGNHVGNLMGIAPTGRKIAIDVMDIVRVREGKYLEHWGINNLASVLAALRTG